MLRKKKMATKVHKEHERRSGNEPRITNYANGKGAEIEQEQTKGTKQAEALLGSPKGDSKRASDHVKSRKVG
jgi:hypothetical protein